MLCIFQWGYIYLETAVKSLTEGQFYKQLSQRLYGWIFKNIYYLCCAGFYYSLLHMGFLSLWGGRDSLVAVHGLPITVAFLVGEHGL